MMESLLRAYTPLLIWPGIGLLISRFVPNRFPKLLGLALYWVGVPLQLLVLGRQTNFSEEGKWIPVIAIGVLLLSTCLAQLGWWGLRQLRASQKAGELKISKNPLLHYFKFNSLDRQSQGSFILAALLGNTGFIGLAITTVLFGSSNSDSAVLYSVTNNVIGTYGFAVLIASYFSRSENKSSIWTQLRDVLSVPSLWTFLIGYNTRFIELPPAVESGFNQAVWIVIASALVLVGLRLWSVQSMNSVKLALIPSAIKIFVLPLVVAGVATYLGVTGDLRLMLTIMSGTPTGLSVLILAEVYELDRDLLACSIAITFVGLLLVLPFWLAWFS